MPAPEGHAKLSPSAAKRWLTCPASVEACANSVSPDTEHSKRGTAGHWARAEWLTKGEPPAVGTAAPNGIVLDQELIDGAGMSVGFIRSYLDEHKGSMLLVEEAVQIGEGFGLEPGICWGTADGIILAPHELVVEDLKLGYTNVVVEDNEQLKLYALGALVRTGWMHDNVRFVITQPKQGGVKEWETTAQAVWTWAQEQAPKAKLALSPDAPYNPTPEACKWCPVAGVCAHAQKANLELARREMSNPAGIIENISMEELTLLLQKSEMIETAMKAVRGHAAALMLAGVEVPGWKLVEGKKDRVWKAGAEATVKEKLGPKAFTEPKLVSPAQAEKAFGKGGKEVFADLWEKPKGEAKLVPASDPRPALPPHFTDVTDVLADLE